MQCPLHEQECGVGCVVIQCDRCALVSVGGQVRPSRDKPKVCMSVCECACASLSALDLQPSSHLSSL